MNSWSSGYVHEVGYTYGYYPELNPERIKLAFLNQGLKPPKIKSACELGFGQGVSVNFNTAGSNIVWHGNDFNPSQAMFAKDLANAVNGRYFTDHSFEEFCRRDDLPEFDFIGLHGIWSWISDENRQHIVELLKQRLAIGGVVYISYNTLPGWASFSPIRYLMTQHAQTNGASSKAVEQRVTDAIKFTEELINTKSKFIRQTAGITQRIEKLQTQDKNYLAHEYFNRDWKPMFFQEMCEWLEPAKLEYACSANYIELVDALNLTDEQIGWLNNFENQSFKETLRDFLTNQQFRKDYWVKGKHNLSKLQIKEQIRGERILLVANTAEVPETVTGALGDMKLQKDIYNPIFDILKNREVQTIGEIENRLKAKNISLELVIQSLLILIGLGKIVSVPNEIRSMKEVKDLNNRIIELSRSRAQIPYLLSPVTGSGVLVSRFNQLFLLAIEKGLTTPNEWAKFAHNLLKEQRQVIIKDGQPLKGTDANLAELISQAEEFDKFALKNLRVLKVA